MHRLVQPCVGGVSSLPSLAVRLDWGAYFSRPTTTNHGTVKSGLGRPAQHVAAVCASFTLSLTWRSCTSTLQGDGELGLNPQDSRLR